MHKDFICSHAVDRSLLNQGFTLSAKMLFGFKAWFGELDLGVSRDIAIILDGVSYKVRIGNRNFDRTKWPTHREMYQVRYNQGGEFAKVLRTKFAATHKFITDELLRRNDIGKKHIEIPASQREQILFYRTDDPLVWEAELQTAAETAIASKAAIGIEESLFESPDWNDTSAKLVLKPAVVKVRRLDRTIGANLKRVYNHRCQICGEQVAELYSTYVDEVHHIEPFVTSLDNNVSNLLVLCPTHHRIIHATHASFIRSKKAFVYPNGLQEVLKLNLHI